jgi:hypothetical protein
MDDSYDGSRGPIVLERQSERGALSSSSYEMDGATSRLRFREFFRNFKVGNIFIYRESLLRHWNQGEYFIEVDLDHIGQFDEILLNNLQVYYLSFIYYLAD